LCLQREDRESLDEDSPGSKPIKKPNINQEESKCAKEKHTWLMAE